MRTFGRDVKVKGNWKYEGDGEEGRKSRKRRKAMKGNKKTKRGWIRVCVSPT